jgi:DNA replication protein DnaC
MDLSIDLNRAGSRWFWKTCWWCNGIVQLGSSDRGKTLLINLLDELNEKRRRRTKVTSAAEKLIELAPIASATTTNFRITSRVARIYLII